MRDVVFATLFLLFATFTIQGAYLGLTLWIWSAIWPVNDYLYGFAKGIPFNKIAVACTLIALFYDKKKAIGIDAMLGWLILLLICVSISFFNSRTPPGWGQMYYENLVKMVFAAVVIRFIAVERLRLHICMLAFAVAVGAGAADEGFKFLLSGGSHHALGPSSWGDENSTATIILMAIPILFYITQYAMHPTLRMAGFATIVMCVIAVIGTYSRGGFIGLSVLSMILYLKSKKKFRNALFFFMVIMIGLSFVPDSWVARIMTTSHAEEDSSFMYRVVQWKILTLMALDQPVFGAGILANLEPATWRSYAARLGSELTFIKTPPPLYPQASHSIFFQMLGENGFVGLFLFLLIHFLALRKANLIRKMTEGIEELRWAADMAQAMRISMIIYLVTGAVLPIPYLEFPYLLMGCIAALHYIVSTKLAPAKAPRQSGPDTLSQERLGTDPPLAGIGSEAAQ